MPDLDGEVTREEIEREFPQWRASRGIDRLFHGLRRTGPPLTAKGESWDDLRDQIRAKESLLEEKPLPRRKP